MAGFLAIAIRVPVCLVLAIGLPLAAMGTTNVTPAHATQTRSTPAWLAEINRYRQAAGLSPVVDQPTWDIGLQHHLHYLALTPKRYVTGP